MKQHLPSLVLLCLSVVGCAESDAPVAPRSPLARPAGVYENVRDIPIDGVFFNECCGEEVQVTGTARFLISDNVIHVVVQDINGIGLSSGLAYTSRGASTETNVFYSHPDEGTFNFRLNMAGENGCSFTVRITNHLTTNANGEVTAAIERAETQCR